MASFLVVLIAIILFICLCAAAAPVSGESRAVCPNPTVEAVEGDSVSLPCHLEPPGSVLNNAVDWKRTDVNKLVCSYRKEKENLYDQMAEYRGRVNVSVEGLRWGNMTLWISSVKTSDTGPYRCFVSKLRASCEVSFIVVPKDQQNRTKWEDFSTTTPPTHEPDTPGAENVKRVHHIILPFVFVSLIIVVITLVIRGMIHAKQENGHER